MRKTWQFQGRPRDLPQPTIAFQRVLQRAAQQVLTAGKEKIEADSVLIAIFAEKESFARYFLSSEGLTRFDLIRWVSHGVMKDGLDLDDDGIRLFSPTALNVSQARRREPTMKLTIKRPMI